MEQEKTPPPLPLTFRQFLRHWFVRYNPLYFFSALCMLTGVFLISPGSKQEGWQFWETVLTAVIELYEILLIAGAGLLFRYAKQYRAAAILGILSAIFLFDTTFQTEVIATFDRNAGIVVAICWILLAAIKLGAIRWAFRLDERLSVCAIPFLGAAGIAIFPHLLSRLNDVKSQMHLVAMWYGIALVAYAFYQRQALQNLTSSEEAGMVETAFERISRAVWNIWAGLYLYHLIAWVYTFDIYISNPVLYCAPILWLFALLFSREQEIWAAAIGTFCIVLFTPSLVAPTALFLGIALVIQARRKQYPRLYIGAILAGYFAIWTLGWKAWPIPPISIWLTVFAIVALAGLSWRFRMPSALLPLLAGVYPLITHLPSFTIRQWGIVLIALAFLSLIGGVLINWQLRRTNGDTNNERREEKSGSTDDIS